MRTIRYADRYDLHDIYEDKVKSAGFARFTVTDAKRKGTKSALHRTFEVLVWYPAEAGAVGKRKAYLSPYQLKNQSLLNFKFGSNKRRILSEQLCFRSIEGAALSDSRQRYPVLVFSHDLGKLPEYYTTLMEQIACEGYFIFSINHPGIAEVSLINDDVKKCKKTTFTGKLLNLRWKMSLEHARKKLVGKTYSEKWNTSRQQLASWRKYHPVFSVMEADRNALLSFLQAMNSARYYQFHPYNIFVQRLDLSNVGVIGHGWGGASAVDSLINNYQVKAAINLNGLQFSNAMNQMISKPLYAIYSKEYAGLNDGIYFNACTNEKYTLENAERNVFLDSCFSNTTPGTTSSIEVAKLCTAFMDRFLKKEEVAEAPPAPVKRMTIL